MRAKTMRLTVLCPFCQTAYTFKTDKNKAKWEQSKGPLHQGCKLAAKEMMS